VVIRGELLQSRRIWGIAFSTLLITIGLTVLLVTGSARWLTRYNRSAVEGAYAWVDSPGSRFARAITVADPIPWIREFGEGWVSRPEWRLTGQSVGYEHIHRSNYGAILDLETGKEVLVRRIDSDDSLNFRAAVSPDGRLAAVIARPLGLTWGARSRYRHLEREWTLEVWDLQSSKRLYSGVPEAMASRPFDVHRVAWSRSGEYLALPVGDPATLYVVRPDGSGLTRLSPRFESWMWATDDVIYGLGEEGVLYRAYPDGRESEVVVSLRSKLNYGPRSWRWMWEPSPDGRWLVVRERFRIEPEKVEGESVGGRRTEDALWAVPTDGSEAHQLWAGGPDHAEGRSYIGGPTWTADGEALLVEYDGEAKSSSIVRWTPEGPLPVTVVSGLAGHLDLLARPDSDEIVIWRWRRGGPGKPWYQATEGTVLLLNGEDEVRELVSRGTAAELATLYSPVGFDTNGRLLLSPRDERAEKPGIHALDLDSGEMQQIYP
jgi:hypothetical protein